jgi:arylsulfatase A-like enzyme
VTLADLTKYADLYHENHLALSFNRAATLERLGIVDELPRLARVIELLYRSNIALLDRLFGEVVDAIDARGLGDTSLIAFTADHGEVLYRESATFKWTHSLVLDHEVLGVPLIVHAPFALKPGSRYAGVTRSIDVLPTLAGLSGIALPAGAGIQGVDLSPALSGEVPEPDLIAYSNTTVLVESVFRRMYDEKLAHHWLEARRFFPDESVDHVWVGLRSKDLWLIHRKLEDGRWATQAFDLAVDPDANRDVFDPQDPRHAALRDQLLAYKKMLVESHAARAVEHALPAQREEELLRSLGYIE